MEDLISIIIPIYNSENYLSTCLNSIIKQTYTNLEIICVDDGSTDSSLKICNTFCNSDIRIKVFHQENKGQSSARNAGLKLSTAKDVYFCDSDDYLKTDAIEQMYHQINNDSELVIMGFYLENDKGELQEIPHKYERICCKTTDDKIKTLFKLTHGYFGPTLWNKMFSKDIIDEYDIRFYDSPVAEDALFTMMYILAMKKTIVFFDYCGYYYLKHSGSVISRISSTENLHHFMYLGSCLVAFSKKTILPEEYIPYVYFKFVANELLRIANRSGYTYAKRLLHKLDSKSHEALPTFKEYIKRQKEYGPINHPYDVKEGAAFCTFFCGGSLPVLKLKLRILNKKYIEKNE